MSKLKFTRGYKEVKEKINKNVRFNRSCDNCDFFYMSKDDEEEVCQNLSVLPYDVSVDENGRTYCSYWKYSRE